MLRMTDAKSATQAKAYYTQSLRKEGYYLKDSSQEVAGAWEGQAVGALGISGAVTKREFFDLCDNVHPALKTQLTSCTLSNRRVGMDITFCAPKALPILYLLFGDKRILGVFEASVRKTMALMEREVKTRVRLEGKDEDRVTGNWIYNGFTHFTDRPVDGVPDLSMHKHCFVINATYDKEEARWKAIQLGDLKRDCMYFESCFHSYLTEGMKQLGYDIDREERFWNVAGVSREVIEKFSNRQREIKAKAAKLGITDVEIAHGLGVKTRSGKVSNISMDDLKKIWLSRLTGSEVRQLSNVGGKSPTRRMTPEVAMSFGIETGFDRYSVVPDKQLMERALRYGFGDVTPEQIQAEFNKADILKAEEDGRLLVTTEEIHAEERAMLSLAKRGKGACIPFGTQTPPSHFTKGQAATFKHVLSSPDRIILVHGGAGTGKTTMLTALNKVISGYFFGSTNPATDNLRQEGFDARTVQYLLLSEPLQHRIKGQTIFVDEAGLLGTKDMRRLFEITEKLGTRVVLVGDVKQHVSVPRGDALHLLQSHAGLQTAHMSEIVRQTGAYRDAVELLQKHDTLEGLQKFQTMGWVIEAPDDVRDNILAEDFVWQLRAGKRVMVVAPTHKEGRRVTKSIRAWMRKEGMLEGPERSFEVLKNTQWDSGQKRDYAYYRPGMVVQFLRRAPGIEQGALSEVKRIQDGKVFIQVGHREMELPMQNADWFQCHEREMLELAIGDKIMPTQAGPTLDGHKLQTKCVYEVKGFDDRGNIRLSNGWLVSKDFKHLAYAYYSTSVSAQSPTVDRILGSFGPDSYGALSMEQQLVSLSRAKESARIYTSDVEEMKLHAIKSSRRGTATELLEGKLSGSAQPKAVALQVARTRELLHRQRAYRERLEATEEPVYDRSYAYAR